MVTNAAEHTHNFALRHLDRIPPEDADTLFHWGQDLWSIDSYRLTWRPWVTSFVGYLEDRPVAHAGVLTQAVIVAGTAVPVGGVAGVITLPEARGRGYATRTLQAATDHLHLAHNVEFALLFCRDQLIPFYGPRGWRKVADTVRIQQPEGERPAPLNCLVRELGTGRWPSGEVRLDSLPW